MTTPLPPGTRGLIDWPRSTWHGCAGVITTQVADKYRVEIPGGGGTFLKPTEFVVITPADARNDS